MSLFVKTDIDIPLDMAAGFTLSDVAGMTVRLEKGSFSLTKTIGAGIVQHEQGFVMSIRRSEIQGVGLHRLYVRITDQGGRQRGIDAERNTVEFVRFPI